MGPTPMLYYAEASSDDVDGGIQITGSHNPANYNGFKMVFQGRPFFGAGILELGRLAGEGAWADGNGAVESRDVQAAYVERLLAGLDGVDPDCVAGLRIGWDAGNGAAGPVLEQLASRLPGEHYLLYTEVGTWRTCANWWRRRISISASPLTGMATGSARSTGKGGSSGATSC